MIFQNEQFTELKEYPGYYVSKSWILLRDTEKGIKICGQTPNSKQDPYWTVTVKSSKGKYYKRSLHRLLMQTFVPNPENKAHVNHLDGDKASRDLNNLEWATPKENAQHAIKIGLRDLESNNIEIHQYFLNGKYITSFKSDAEAQRQTGVMKTNISKCSVGDRDHAEGFIWSRIKTETVLPVTRKIVSHFNVTDTQNNTNKYKYIGLFSRNPNPKKAHPILKEMGNIDILKYGKYVIERIYYK